MKSFIFCVLLLLGALVTTFAQPSQAPFSSANEAYSQMWRAGWSYYNTLNIATPTTVLGNQKDTTDGATVLYLSICDFGKFTRKPVTNPVRRDTFTVAYLIGIGGTMKFTMNATQVTSGDSVRYQLQQSSNGINYTDVGSVVTLVPTSTVTPVTSQIEIPVRYDRTYRFYIYGKATKASMVQCWWHWQNTN